MISTGGKALQPEKMHPVLLIPERDKDKPGKFRLNLGDLTPGNAYSVRIIAVGDNGTYFARNVINTVYVPENLPVKEISSAKFKEEQKGSINMRLFPNPATEEVNVEMPAGPKTIRITDMSGQEVYRQTTKAGFLRVDVTHFKPGAYILSVGTEKTTRSFKFIKK